MLMRDRLLARVAVNPFTGCWLWQGAISDNGYGNIWTGSTVQSTHRAAHEAFIGPIPEGHDVHHRCEVRHCINPAHLVAKTRLEHAQAHPAPPACPKGHTEFRIKRGRWRDCAVCHREQERARRASR